MSIIGIGNFAILADGLSDAYRDGQNNLHFVYNLCLTNDFALGALYVAGIAVASVYLISTFDPDPMYDAGVVFYRALAKGALVFLAGLLPQALLIFVFNLSIHDQAGLDSFSGTVAAYENFVSFVQGALGKWLRPDLPVVIGMIVFAGILTASVRGLSALYGYGVWKTFASVFGLILLTTSSMTLMTYARSPFVRYSVGQRLIIAEKQAVADEAAAGAGKSLKVSLASQRGQLKVIAKSVIHASETCKTHSFSENDCIQAITRYALAPLGSAVAQTTSKAVGKLIIGDTAGAPAQSEWEFEASDAMRVATQAEGAAERKRSALQALRATIVGVVQAVIEDMTGVEKGDRLAGEFADDFVEDVAEMASTGVGKAIKGSNLIGFIAQRKTGLPAVSIPLRDEEVGGALVADTAKVADFEKDAAAMARILGLETKLAKARKWIVRGAIDIEEDR